MKLLLLELLMQHWGSILIIAAVMLLLGIMWTRGYKKEVKAFVYDFIVQVEVELGNTSGLAKKTRVKRWIYESAPWIVKVFITPDTFDDIIEAAVDKLKEFLMDGGDLLSYSENNALEKKYLKVD